MRGLSMFGNRRGSGARDPLAAASVARGGSPAVRRSPQLLMASYLEVKRAGDIRRARTRLVERVAAAAAFSLMLSLALTTAGLSLWSPPLWAPARFEHRPGRPPVLITPLDTVPRPFSGAPRDSALGGWVAETRGPAGLREPSRRPPAPADSLGLATHAAFPGVDSGARAARHLWRAQEAFVDGAFDTALREARHARRLGGGADALVVAGNVHFSRRQYSLALAAFREAQHLAPRDPKIAHKVETTQAMADPERAE
jgi:hypothetical protein